ncbi:hypothetical protein DFS34DRAFT_650308 [Phlyctochytrium arcticum]|nr:hypothetical protein DFS34DRAFT_650308 [Phlyctochytrium arcticum]
MKVLSFVTVVFLGSASVFAQAQDPAVPAIPGATSVVAAPTLAPSTVPAATTTLLPTGTVTATLAPGATPTGNATVPIVSKCDSPKRLACLQNFTPDSLCTASPQLTALVTCLRTTAACDFDGLQVQGGVNLPADACKRRAAGILGAQGPGVSSGTATTGPNPFATQEAKNNGAKVSYSILGAAVAVAGTIFTMVGL